MADQIARSGKLKQVGVKVHDRNRKDNIRKLNEMLVNKTYKTSEYTIFKIYEPKERVIYRLPYFPDRITHHAIMNIMEPIFVSTFTADTYSCIKGRGIHKAQKALKKALKDKLNTTYCLKLDIRKFYPSIDHDILKKLIRRKIKDYDLLWLLDGIIDSAEGLPIGNYLSQYLANFYLSYFDHWIKENKGVKYYFRYADDMVILANNKAYLHNLLTEIKAYLSTHLNLQVKGKNYTWVNNDNVEELPRMASNSVGLILTSIPFEMQYEYSPNYADYGHCESSDEFWKQMDYSTPEALRVLMPGRICAIHVKDRIVPGGINGRGYQTVSPVHMRCIEHFTKHGFGYIGMKTIVTDVVRENSQTYRLGWTEQCKDGSKMGVGMPEYLLLFRKDPTDTSNAYADIPVLKEKREYDKKNKHWSKGYSRARWQMDAHGFTRSSGDRLLDPEEVARLESDAIFKIFKTYSLEEVWDFEQVVQIAENVEAQGKLPPGFMLLQPQSWSDEVWTDITRMRTLNGSQWSLGREMHVCPFQIDIVERVIDQMSNPGDTVLDYFGGLGTVPLVAIQKGRKGYGIELNPIYWADGANYLKAEEQKQDIPTLFDLISETA